MTTTAKQDEWITLAEAISQRICWICGQPLPNYEPDYRLGAGLPANLPLCKGCVRRAPAQLGGW